MSQFLACQPNTVSHAQPSKLRKAWDSVKNMGKHLLVEGLILAVSAQFAIGCSGQSARNLTDAQTDDQRDGPGEIYDGGTSKISTRDLIVFSSYTLDGPSYNIYVMDGFNGPITQLTFGEVYDHDPTWCVLPNGSVNIVFESTRPDRDLSGLIRVFKIDVNLDDLSATEPIAITNTKQFSFSPQCSKSGRVYGDCVLPSGGSDISGFCSMDINEKELKMVYEKSDIFQRFPNPSADESELLYEREISLGIKRIFKLPLADGIATGTPIQLTFGSNEESHSSPSFSPVSSIFSFTIFTRNDDPNIIAIASSVDGSNLTQMTINGSGTEASFSRPDGKYVVVHTYENTSILAAIPITDKGPGSISPIAKGNMSFDHPEMYTFPE